MMSTASVPTAVEDDETTYTSDLNLDPASKNSSRGQGYASEGNSGNGTRAYERNSNDEEEEEEEIIIVHQKGGAAASTNEQLLCTAFVSFMGFALLQLVFALVAQSQAMLGDSAAMIVDAFTYLFNLCAERRKSRLDDLVRQQHHETNHPLRLKRKLELHMEIYPPLLSVGTLIGVIFYVMQDAIQVLFLKSKEEPNTPNIRLMMIFSVLNLVLDAVNVGCFARIHPIARFKGMITRNKHPPSPLDDAVHLDRDPNHHRNHKKSHYCQVEGMQLSDNGRDNVEEEHGVELPEQKQASRQLLETPMPNGMIMNGNVENNLVQVNGEGRVNNGVTLLCIHGNHNDGNHYSQWDEDGVFRGETRLNELGGKARTGTPNLNMCSAFTHVFADTLRSLAVIVAAAIAEARPDSVTPEEADATAAIVVSVIILISLAPLLQGLFRSISELRAIRAEELAERVDPILTVDPML